MPPGAKVQEMFSHIAPRYDLVNRVLSAGVDRRWRRRAVALAGADAEDLVLDVCCGTGDLSLDLARSGARVVGSDFTYEMLKRVEPKVRAVADRLSARPVFVAGDTMDLPFRDDSFDLVTVAFGIRNVSDVRGGLEEMLRVTRPGGRVVVLEFCKPRVPVVRGLYGFYFRRILPAVGRWISGDTRGAYSYLPQSVMAFPERGDFLSLMQRAGFHNPSQHILTCGIAALYRAEVPS